MLGGMTPHDTILTAACTGSLLTAEAQGVSHWALVALEREGVLERILPGVYIGSNQPKQLVEEAAITLKNPTVVIGGLTAAVLYGLVDAFARGTWVLVPKGVPVVRSGLIRVVRATHLDPKLDDVNGITSTTVHGVTVRMTNPDRTVIDLFRLQRRISYEHVYVALRRHVWSKLFDEVEFTRLCKQLGAWTPSMRRCLSFLTELKK